MAAGLVSAYAKYYDRTKYNNNSWLARTVIFEDFFSGFTKDDNFKVISEEIKKCKELDSSFVQFCY